MRPKHTPHHTSFRPTKNQGLVLRDGVICERVEGFADFVAEPDQILPNTSTLSRTFELIKKLRSVLPYGTSNRGMLLIRVCNFEHMPQSKVSVMTSTPFHTDRKEYGDRIFGLCLTAGSLLVF